MNYCLPCLQTKLQVWQQDFLEVWRKQDLEEMKNFKIVKALGAQTLPTCGRRKQHDERGRLEVSE